jgi:hypothetical protein
VRGSLFLRNVNTGGAGGGLRVTKSFGAITDNVFAFDSTYGGNTGAGGLYALEFFGPIVRNTFVGCHVDAPSPGAAVITGDGSSLFEFANNLIVGCTGGGAIGVFTGQSLPGMCNGLWNNAGGLGGYVPDATDVFQDPHLRTGEPGVFSSGEFPLHGSEQPILRPDRGAGRRVWSHVDRIRVLGPNQTDVQIREGS